MQMFICMKIKGYILKQTTHTHDYYTPLDKIYVIFHIWISKYV